VPEQVRWFEEARDYSNGVTIIEFVQNEGDTPVEYTANNADILAYIRNGTPLSFGTDHDNDIASQMVNRYAGNYVTYWGRVDPYSVRSISNHMTQNNMFMRDRYIGPPTESMQLFQGGLDSDFHVTAVNIIVGAEPIEAFDAFVADWHSNGGQAITDEVNEWWRSTR
jgi:putative aldouronate transport system substrate-binding protein